MRLILGTGGEVDSRTAHNRLKGSATQVSRASAIKFLKKMAEEGFLKHREVTSKGGRKRLYRPSRVAPDEKDFRRALADRIFNKLRTELLGDAVSGVDPEKDSIQPNRQA
jgi:DNA-binding PadR family transcriptional regulator